MLEVGQNWSKIANYPPNAQHKSAPLTAVIKLWETKITHTTLIMQTISRLFRYYKIQPYTVDDSFVIFNSTEHYYLAHRH